MKWLSIICLLCSVASPGLANEVLVSVGQKPDVTRLVFTFENRPDWSLEDTSEVLNLVFDPSSGNIEFSIEDSFLSDSRVAEISLVSERNAISVELSCDCAAQVYPYGTGSLIVDVRDKLRVADVENVMPLSPDQPVIRPDQNDVQTLSPSMDKPVQKRGPASLDASDGFDDPPTIIQSNWELNNVEFGLAETLGFSMRSSDDSHAVEYLGRELSRAAAQGLVQPGTDQAQVRPSERQVNAGSNLSDRSNISVVTSIDRDILANRDPSSPTDLGAVCFSDREVDLTNWGDTADISTLGQLRRDAYAENGEVRPEGAHAVARYYIALGFGAEASSVATFMEPGKPKQLIQALAEIVDHGFSDSPVLDGQIFCEGKVALWAALARPIGKDGPPVSTDSILATFSALPPHQRAHLGPVLAERLREVGLEDAARNAVNAVARGGLQSNESELVTARMALDGTRPDTARETLVDISTGTDVTAAEALLELLEDAERRDMAPNPRWVEDAPSLARATEGADIAGRLNIAGLRGRIALGQFDQLRLALAEDTPGLNTQTRAALASSALVVATQLAETPNFLRAEVGLSKLLNVSDLPHADQFEIARRLLDIGLVDRAERYLGNEPTSIMEFETVADVLTKTGQTARAVSLLSGRIEEATARKLGEVFSAVGQDEDAVKAYERGGSMDAAARAAMRSGDWEWIAEREIAGQSGALSETTRLLLSPTETSNDPGNPANGELITTSQEIRRHVAALLSETSLEKAQPFTN